MEKFPRVSPWIGGGFIAVGGSFFAAAVSRQAQPGVALVPLLRGLGTDGLTWLAAATVALGVILVWPAMPFSGGKKWRQSVDDFAKAMAYMSSHFDKWVAHYDLIPRYGFAGWRDVFQSVGWPDRLRDGEPLSSWTARYYGGLSDAERVAVNCARSARDGMQMQMPGNDRDKWNEARMAMRAEIEKWVEWSKSRRFRNRLDDTITEYHADLVLFAYLQVVNAETMTGKLEPAGPWSRLPIYWPTLAKPVTPIARRKGAS